MHAFAGAAAEAGQSDHAERRVPRGGQARRRLLRTRQLPGSLPAALRRASRVSPLQRVTSRHVASHAASRGESRGVTWRVTRRIVESQKMYFYEVPPGILRTEKG